MILSGIYKIICCNNKFYIGSSVNINRRLKDHIRSLKRNKHGNKYLQNAWNKYGENNFRYEIIETISDIKTLPIREKWWLNHTNCCDRKIGFNISINASIPNIKRKFIDLTGQNFGELIVLKQKGVDKRGRALWLCLCSCGKEKTISSSNLIRGNTRSCGHLRNKNRLNHGHSRRNHISRTYIAYNNMIQTCLNSNNKAYKYYGGRGITVCDRWLPENNGFVNFLKDIGEISDGLTLSRIDNDKLINGYSPENCILSTSKRKIK